MADCSATCAPAPAHQACALPCDGCDEAIAAARSHGRGHDLHQSQSDGCWVVRIGFAEKLRSDSPCLACSYFRNKTELLTG
ncbi:hypothetical protein A6A04_00750 [Paramagnetospirillum marisnigri]|uniref:Uncharacterized protein n=1 Tax=Paramagnetospirillum marisnigri TaxID=1285242 RepID=A0A178MS09_9PROT|nr:hypothetical protein [Paramagnetospirillum marisnigri]OAN52255.1 hypothetical protein A6A04_00750 [Paramagnetospirillum marisnigri]